MEYVFAPPAVRLPVDWLPDVPVHPVGDTKQEFTFEDAHEIVADSLKLSGTGPSEPLALMFADGTWRTCTVCSRLMLPPGPEQERP